MAKQRIGRNARRGANSLVYQPRRRQDWAGLSTREILALHPPCRTPPLEVLEILIYLFNKEHTARHKEVSFKTRQERADFLRRFFHALKRNAGFKTLPDPRNLGHRHVRAIVAVWQKAGLAPATIQTYLSFLRGFEKWIGKPGLVRLPQHYGLKPAEYERHEAAQCDRSWSAQGINIDELVVRMSEFDPYVGACVRLERALALRRKESLMLRPHLCVVPFESTGLPLQKRAADFYARIKAGAKGGRERFVPLDTPARINAIEHAKTVVANRDGHMGRPSHTLEQALRRFNYVLEKFGVTRGKLGVTAHGLRHEALIEHFVKLTGVPPPIQGGTGRPAETHATARQEVAELAGHARKRAANAYLGTSTPAPRGPNPA